MKDTTTTDPMPLAHEVLQHELAVTCASQAISSGSIEPEDYRSLAESTERLAMLAPDLARAVLAVAELADRIEEAGKRSDALSGIAPGSVASAEDIRSALYGGNT